MGGGMSAMGRSNAGEPLVVPPKIRPMLERRFEEMKKRKGASKLPVESTLSKKQLLKEDTDEYDENSQYYETCDETKKEEKISAREIQQTEEEIAKQVVTPEKQSRVVPLPNIECNFGEEKEPDKGGKIEQDKKQKEHDDKEKVVQDEAKAETEVNAGEKDETCADAKSVEDNDDDETEELSRFLPGSPSFRIYCIEAEKREEEEGGEKHTVAMHQRYPSADSGLESAAPESPSSEKLAIVPVAAVRPSTERKGNKTKKFGAVRTLFKVKSCYYPICSCTGDQRRNIVQARASN